MIRIITTRRLRQIETARSKERRQSSIAMQDNWALRTALLKIRDLHTGRTDLIDDTTHDCLPSNTPCVTVQIVDQTLVNINAPKTMTADGTFEWRR